MIKNINKKYGCLEKKASEPTPFIKHIAMNNTINKKAKNEKEENNKKKTKNNKKNKTENMDKNNLKKANDIINSINNNENNVKHIKSENGLIERIDSDKVVLTEDNKMLLKD